MVRSNGSDLDGVGCIGWTTIDEGRADEGDDVIAPGEDEVSDKTLVSIDDEVATEFFGFFVPVHELGSGGFFKVATNRLRWEYQGQVDTYLAT